MLAEPVSSNVPRGGVPRNEAMTEYPSSTIFTDSFTVTSDYDRAFPADVNHLSTGTVQQAS